MTLWNIFWTYLRFHILGNTYHCLCWNTYSASLFDILMITKSLILWILWCYLDYRLYGMIPCVCFIDSVVRLFLCVPYFCVCLIDSAMGLSLCVLVWSIVLVPISMCSATACLTEWPWDVLDSYAVCTHKTCFTSKCYLWNLRTHQPLCWRF